MYQSLSPTTQLLYSTSRVQAVLADGQVATGTGFYVQLSVTENIKADVLVTNKHVIRGAKTGRIYLTVELGSGEPNNNQHINLEIPNFETYWIKHPDPNIDLCIMPIVPVLQKIRGAEQPKVFYLTIPQDRIATENVLKEFGAVEDILMVGYPNGLWDETHNFPLFRKGITSTHPAYHFNGRPEFLIDAACFPGSSGSPVFIFNQGSYLDKSGNLKAGYRVFLIGILHAGPQHTIDGEVIIVDVPTTKVQKAISTIPNNLGYVIRADKLLDFNPIIFSMLK
jgi:hypothetical protein